MQRIALFSPLLLSPLSVLPLYRLWERLKNVSDWSERWATGFFNIGKHRPQWVHPGYMFRSTNHALMFCTWGQTCKLASSKMKEKCVFVKLKKHCFNAPFLFASRQNKYMSDTNIPDAYVRSQVCLRSTTRNQSNRRAQKHGSILFFVFTFCTACSEAGLETGHLTVLIHGAEYSVILSLLSTLPLLLLLLLQASLRIHDLHQLSSRAFFRTFTKQIQAQLQPACCLESTELSQLTDLMTPAHALSTQC